MAGIPFSKLRHHLGSAQNSTASNGHNGTTTLTELPTTLLEAFIPGYSLISGFILDAFGFDVSILVSGGLIIFACVHVGSYIWQKAFAFFSEYLMSSVYVDDGDDLFDSILDWIGEQAMSRKSRSVKAVTRYAQTAGESGEADDDEALDEKGIFNFGKWAARLPPRYEPYFGVHRFWYNGRLFFFDRSRREVNVNPWSGRPSDEQLIRLTCIGRSTDPIRLLLYDIKARSLEKEKSLTNIRRPAPKELSRRQGAWDRVSSRPSRPMDTVSLDAEQKAMVVADINEYLHPSSPRWYSIRGIPWRRGYLFHGPPGTGKSSFSFAIAGLFGLDIYVISLLEPTLTEGDLNRLFNNLPRRCVVLLEDIDTAGLLRDEKSDQEVEDDGGTKKDGKEEKFTAQDLAKAIKSANRKDKSNDETKTGISLSGLLNAIDGVASHEGRVLVMTTNHPEKLDAALIRPGRVDLQVPFTLATHDQMRDIYVRMYTNEYDDSALQYLDKKSKLKPIISLTNGISKKPGEAKTPNGSTNGSIDGKVNGITPSQAAPFHLKGPNGIISKEELHRLAKDFANRLPEGKFSPAEVQGFLLIRKKEPYRAIEEVDAWRDAMLEAKGKNSKVIEVQ